MFIQNQTKTSISNSDFIVNFYIGGDNKSIKASFSSAGIGGTELARYTSLHKAQAALNLLFSAMNNNAVIFEMPRDEELTN